MMYFTRSSAGESHVAQEGQEDRASREVRDTRKSTKLRILAGELEETWTKTTRNSHWEMSRLPGKTYGQQTLSCCASPSGELSLNREDREAVILVPLPCETNPDVNPS